MSEETKKKINLASMKADRAQKSEVQEEPIIETLEDDSGTSGKKKLNLASMKANREQKSKTPDETKDNSLDTDQENTLSAASEAKINLPSMQKEQNIDSLEESNKEVVENNNSSGDTIKTQKISLNSLRQKDETEQINIKEKEPLTEENNKISLSGLKKNTTQPSEASTQEEQEKQTIAEQKENVEGSETDTTLSNTEESNEKKTQKNKNCEIICETVCEAQEEKQKEEAPMKEEENRENFSVDESPDGPNKIPATTKEKRQNETNKQEQEKATPKVSINKKSDKKNDKISGQSTKKTKGEKIIVGDQVLADEPDGMFQNYTSDFEKEEGSIIKKIKQLKNLPKTRPALVVGLIGCTLIILVALYFWNPERYSLQSYKTALLGYSKSGTGEKSATNNENKEESTATGSSTPPPVKIVRGIESIIRSGYKITLESRMDESGTKIYRYNNTEFKTLEELNKALDLDIQKLKNKKVKNFLLQRKKPKTKTQPEIPSSDDEPKLPEENKDQKDSQKALLKMLQNKK